MKKFLVNPLSGELHPVEDFDQLYAQRGHTHHGYAQVDLATGKLLPTAAHDLVAEYSADGEGWRKEQRADDRYLRLSGNGGASWGEKIKIAAERISSGDPAPQWSYALEPEQPSPLAWTVDEALR